MAPHLRPGAFAIVDTADKERGFGELYVITIEGGRGGPQPTIVELIKGFGTGNEPGTVGAWYAFSLTLDTNLGGRRGRVVDGPPGFEHRPGKCCGRVVEVMVPGYRPSQVAGLTSPQAPPHLPARP